MSLKQRAAVLPNRLNKFASQYTETTNGFYVRNNKPSSAVVNEQRTKDNLRTLLDNESSEKKEQE